MKRKLLGFAGRLILTLAGLYAFTALLPGAAHVLALLLAQSAVSLAVLVLGLLTLREYALRWYAATVQMKGIGRKSSAQVRIRDQ